MTEEYINSKIQEQIDKDLEFVKICKINNIFYLDFINKKLINNCSCNNNCDGCPKSNYIRIEL
jgi:hypothetical protein